MDRRLRLLFVIVFLFLPNKAQCEPSLVGTTPNLIRLNRKADELGYRRIKDDKELEKMKEAGELLPIPGTVRIDKDLDPKWRWALPQTTYLIGDLGLEFREKFGRSFQITSAVRTFQRQVEISKSNLNAVPPNGPRRSLHLTGSTIDITKLDLTDLELNWLRQRLLELESLDILDATEEQLQKCFHVTVFSNYEYVVVDAN